MTSKRTRLTALVSATLTLGCFLTACGNDDGASVDPGPSATPTGTTSIEPASPARSLVAFGDSWPYGAHCNGCTPFPDLYAEALNTERPTEFTNLTENGGTTDSLLAEMRHFEPYRTAIKGADVIVISIGANDLEDAFATYGAGDCGPPKGLGCFRNIADAWGAHMDSMLTQIHDLRGPRPTAIRVLTQANEDDPGLRAGFGESFIEDVLPQVMAWQKQEFCRAAARHHDRCVDLRLVLNGPKLDKLRDVNTQEAMQEVADSLLAIGLPELNGV